MSPSLYISFSRSQETEWPPVSLAAVLVLAVLLSVAVVVAACSAVQLWWCSKEEARSASGQVVGPQQREPRCPAMGRWSPVPAPSSRGTVASRVRVGEGRRGERKCEAMGREKTQRKRSHSGQQKKWKKKKGRKRGNGVQSSNRNGCVVVVRQSAWREREGWNSRLWRWAVGGRGVESVTDGKGGGFGCAVLFTNRCARQGLHRGAPHQEPS